MVNNYDIIVAQNFLSGLTTSGPSPSTLNTDFKRLKEKEKPCRDTSSDEGTSSKGEFTLFDDLRDTPKKVSFLQRIAKIMSTEDVIQSQMRYTLPIGEEVDSNDDYIPDAINSPLFSNNFGFIKRLKSSITNNEWYYMCSDVTKCPFVVCSYNPMSVDLKKNNSLTPAKINYKRSKSIFGRFYVTEPFEAIFYSYCSNEKFRAIRGDHYDDLKPHSFREQESMSLIKTRMCQNCIGNDDELFESLNEIELDNFDSNKIGDGKRTVIRLNGYIGTTMHYQPADRAKISMNESFTDLYPHINLTLSKLKSLKRELLELALLLSIDVQTVAMAFAYFEKIVAKGKISKINRKCVAGVSLLISMKINDYNKNSIKMYIEKASEKLREPKDYLLSYELPVCTALDFKLLLLYEDIQPHLDHLQFEMI